MAATKTAKKIKTTTKKVTTKDGRQPGFASVNPCLSVANPAKEIQFLVRAFGFKKNDVCEHEGKIVHANLKFGECCVMLGQENPKFCKSALTLGGSPIGLYLYVKNVDATTKQAASVGGKVTQQPTDQFWGDRVSCIVDPEGYSWYLATYTGKFSEPDFSACGDA
jgi:PhnB protein